MQAFTPRLPTNSVFEMYASVWDKYDATRIMYDTVKCSMEYWGQGQTNTVNEFEVDDYQSDVTFNEITTVGNNLSSVAQLLDTANGGTSDWWLSPFAGDNQVECTESYCNVSCVVYRQ